MSERIIYFFFIHLIVIDVESDSIFNAIKHHTFSNSSNTNIVQSRKWMNSFINNPGTNFVRNGLKQGRQITASIQDTISNNSVASFVTNGVKKGTQMTASLQNRISNNSVTNFIKNGVTLNCFGIPFGLFDDIIEKVFMQSTKAEDVRFYFHSRDQKKPVTVLAKTKNINLSKINFSTDRRTVVISHGFMSRGSEEWIKNLARSFLKMDDLNVIAVDWEKGSNTWNYYEASISTRVVGTEIAKLLYNIKQEAQFENSSLANLGKLHLVGHSLGAHICAHASYQIKQLQIHDSLKWDVERISGLDPAQPCFTSADPSLKLDKGDASYVDVIHSNGRQLFFLGLGLPNQLGHHDFYPNGGQIQIGCDNIDTSFWKSLMLPVNMIKSTICSHGRSHQLFTDSIKVKLSGSCVYQGHKWNKKYENLEGLLKKKCDDVCPELGINAINYHNSNKDGIYFVPTGRNPHYCEITKEDSVAIHKQLRQDRFMGNPMTGLTDTLFGFGRSDNNHAN